MIFIESPIFTRYVKQLMSEQEYASLQWFLINTPDAGDIIPGSGGLRKIRWTGKNSGKRGGRDIVKSGVWRLHQAATWLSSNVTRLPSLNFTPSITSAR